MLIDISEQRFLNNRIAALVNSSQGTYSETSCTQASTSSMSTPILFVHGYLDNANSFVPILPFFKSYDCVAIDLAGHGRSSHRSADAHYHLSDYVYDLYCIVNESNWSTITLVGHSLGGIVSTMFAACFPELVNRLILIESLGPLTEKENTSVFQLRDSMLSRVSANKPIKPPGSLKRLVEARMKVSNMSEANAELIMRRNTESLAHGLQWRTDKRLRTKSPMRLTENQAADVLKNIQCPVHLVLGDKGFDKIKNMLSVRQRLIQNFSYTTESGGHHVHMDSPEQVAKSILRFVETGQASDPSY